MSAADWHRALKGAGITLASSLPDDWVAPLIAEVARDPEMIHVPVAREVEIVGVCAGAWWGGGKPVAIMGKAGLLACAHEFTTLNLAHQVPLLIVSTMRGTREDPRTYQVAQGMVGMDYLRSLRIPYEVLDEAPDADLIEEAYTHALLMKRPFVLLGRKGALRARKAVAA